MILLILLTRHFIDLRSSNNFLPTLSYQDLCYSLKEPVHQSCTLLYLGFAFHSNDVLEVRHPLVRQGPDK